MRPSATTPASPATPPDLATLLAQLASTRTDALAWTALLDTRDPEWRLRAAWLQQNLSRLDITFAPTGRTRTDGDGRTAHAVRTTWAVPGTGLAEHLVWLIVTNDGAGTRLAGLAGDVAVPQPEPLWAIEPIRVAERDGAVALAGAGVDPEPWLTAMTRARLETARLDPARLEPARVESTRPRPDPLVAQLPSTAHGFERVLGVQQGSHRLVAAAAWPFGPAAHLVVNPETGGATSGAARQVLVTHEAVHLVTGSVRGQRPLWLIEGYADLIALAAHAGVADAHERHLADDQRRHGVASDLVTDAELAPTHPRVQAHYERAWLTVRTLARGPEGTAVAGRVHAAVLDGTSLPDALAAEGWSEATLTEAVTAELHRLAG